jgi:hypothetical protein
MRRNPVKRGLVEEPEQWRWSSYLSYASGEVGLVRIDDSDVLRIRKEQAEHIQTDRPIRHVVSKDSKSTDILQHLDMSGSLRWHYWGLKNE